MLDNVVPSREDVLQDMRAELVEMSWWDDARLMEAAGAQMPAEDQARMSVPSARGLSTASEQELPDNRAGGPSSTSNLPPTSRAGLRFGKPRQAAAKKSPARAGL